MTRQAILDKTIKKIKQLPDSKIQEISDFADFIIKKYEESLLTEEIQKLASESQSFDFLNNEEDIYSEDDLKELY